MAIGKWFMTIGKWSLLVRTCWICDSCMRCKQFVVTRPSMYNLADDPLLQCNEKLKVFLFFLFFDTIKCLAHSDHQMYRLQWFVNLWYRQSSACVWRVKKGERHIKFSCTTAIRSRWKYCYYRDLTPDYCYCTGPSLQFSEIKVSNFEE